MYEKQAIKDIQRYIKRTPTKVEEELLDELPEIKKL